LISNWPDREDRIIISIAKLEKLTNGFYTPDNFISVDSGLMKDGSKEEITSLLLHELTHYAEGYSSGGNRYALWLSEGIAAYSEIEYIERKFPDFGGSIPTSIEGVYNKLPTKEEIIEFYLEGEEIYELDNYEKGRYVLYPIYGFVINNYIKSMSKEKFVLAIDEIKKDSLKKLELKGFVLDEDGNEIALKYLTEEGGKIGERKLFFPNEELFNQSQDRFFREMSPLIREEIPSEKIIEYQKVNKSAGKKIIIRPLFIGIIIASVIIIISIILARPKKKK